MLVVSTVLIPVSFGFALIFSVILILIVVMLMLFISRMRGESGLRLFLASQTKKNEEKNYYKSHRASLRCSVGKLRPVFSKIWISNSRTCALASSNSTPACR